MRALGQRHLVRGPNKAVYKCFVLSLNVLFSFVYQLTAIGVWGSPSYTYDSYHDNFMSIFIYICLYIMIIIPIALCCNKNMFKSNQLYPTQRVAEGIMFLTRPSVSLSVSPSVRQSCFSCQRNSSETAQQFRETL